MARKPILPIVGMLLVALFSVACAVPTTVPPTPIPPITLVDDAGRTVTLEGVPQRIVTLSPSNAEIVFAVGAGDRVVGVSDFTDYPPEAAEIESVGGLPLNIERIVALAPDLVLAQGSGFTSSEDIARLEGLGLRVVVVAPQSIAEILQAIVLVGRAVGSEASAADLVAELESRLEAVRSRTEAVTSRPRVYYELDPNLFSVGPGSFGDALITLAAGENIAAEALTPYPQLSAEQIIAADPQIIIFSHAKYGGTAEEIASRAGWAVIAAVKEGAIYSIDPDLVDRPGPRIIDGLEAMAGLIHPELLQT